MAEVRLRNYGSGGLFSMGYRSPSIPVWLDGFEATTTQLQRFGWRLACDEDMTYGDFRIAIEHQGLGVVALSGRIRHSGLLCAMNKERDMSACEPIRMVQITQSKNLVYTGLDNNYGIEASPWHAIDATPRFIEKVVRPEDLFMFAPVDTKAQEIIADPETVADLMEKIIKLQKPDMDRIREQNRRREARESLTGVVTHAKIISFREAA